MNSNDCDVHIVLMSLYDIDHRIHNAEFMIIL